MRIKHAILLISISLVLMLFADCENVKQRFDRWERKKHSLKKHIGEKFPIENIVDTTGKLAKLDFTKSELTIIDFWFDTCPPCIEEMKQFEELLRGKENKITVISISINRYSLWKSRLAEHSGRFSFLTNSVSNWKHYSVKSIIDERLKNDLPLDSHEELEKKLNVMFYPAYFIVDKNGVIQSRPTSAVDFIKDYN